MGKIINLKQDIIAPREAKPEKKKRLKVIECIEGRVVAVVCANQEVRGPDGQYIVGHKQLGVAFQFHRQDGKLYLVQDGAEGVLIEVFEAPDRVIEASNAKVES